ncbi:MAG: two-component system aerobic respiration control sensor histidine kinase ArcB [Phenylobacterium sp.]|jgi:two-component system aerobic respiration control sensor histidine kinase ArcB
MANTTISPWAKTFSSLIHRWGGLNASSFIYLVVIISSLIISAAYHFILTGELSLHDVMGTVIFASIISPVFIYGLINLITHLEKSIADLKGSAAQEILLNESFKENIRRLNYEIEERKKAFQAKRSAVDELRKEIINRKKAQQELEEQSLLLRSIVDSSPDLFYYRDVAGRFAGCNKMFEVLVGKTASELIGKYASDIYSTNQASSAILTDQEVSASQSAVTLDIEYEMSDGSVSWFEMRKVPFYDSNSNYIGLLGFGRDITARKLAEQALEKAYLDKGNFIATLSHELRTPLNGIVGLTRILLESSLDEQQRSCARTVFSSAETLGNIFNDIIDLDKVDRNEVDIVRQSVYLHDFATDTLNFGCLIAEEKGLTFDFTINGDVDVYGMVDPTRVRQVLWNLINNAVKFTQQGSVGFTLDAFVDDDGEHKVRFTVKDTGIGISPEDIANIFNLYYKGGDNKGLNALGSGIGLAVSKALVEKMDGTVKVSSEINIGSQFIVTLPVEISGKPEDKVYEIRQLNVLLVEDVPLNARIAKSLLEQRGHEVIWAEDGEEALALVETEDDIDLVLLDMKLPDMNGDEIARIIRADSHFDNLVIVALTANVGKAQEQLRGINIQGALAKPINTQKLDNMLAELFEQKPVQSVSSKAPPKPAATTVQPILDEQTLKDYLETLGAHAFKQSIELFEQLLPSYLNKMVESVVVRNLEEFQSSAHKLKGAAGSVGLAIIQLRAKDFERNETPKWEFLEKQLMDFHQEINRDVETLKAHVNKWAAQNS